MERHRFLPNSERLRAAGIEVWRNFYPPDLLARQARHCMSMPTRKETYTINSGESFPAPIDEANRFIKTFFDTRGRINTSVMKRYEPGESSNAFKWHQDPPELQDESLWVISLSGLAYLTAVDEDSEPIECPPNTLVKMPGKTWHKISPPVPEYGTREIQFFGYQK